LLYWNKYIRTFVQACKPEILVLVAIYLGGGVNQSG